MREDRWPWHQWLPAVARSRCRTALERVVVTAVLEIWGAEHAGAGEVTTDHVLSMRSLVRAIYGSDVSRGTAAGHRRTLRRVVESLARRGVVDIRPERGCHRQRVIDLEPLFSPLPCAESDGGCMVALLCGPCCEDGRCVLCAAAERVASSLGLEPPDREDGRPTCPRCGSGPPRPTDAVPIAYSAEERRTCATCGELVAPPRRRYCSDRCYHQAELIRPTRTPKARRARNVNG